jgi:hypothetical protein
MATSSTQADSGEVSAQHDFNNRILIIRPNSELDGPNSEALCLSFRKLINPVKFPIAGSNVVHWIEGWVKMMNQDWNLPGWMASGELGNWLELELIYVKAFRKENHRVIEVPFPDNARVLYLAKNSSRDRFGMVVVGGGDPNTVSGLMAMKIRQATFDVYGNNENFTKVWKCNYEKSDSSSTLVRREMGMCVVLSTQSGNSIIICPRHWSIRRLPHSSEQLPDTIDGIVKKVGDLIGLP